MLVKSIRESISSWVARKFDEKLIQSFVISDNFERSYPQRQKIRIKSVNPATRMSSWQLYSNSLSCLHFVRCLFLEPCVPDTIPRTPRLLRRLWKIREWVGWWRESALSRQIYGVEQLFRQADRSRAISLFATSLKPFASSVSLSTCIVERSWNPNLTPRPRSHEVFHSIFESVQPFRYLVLDTAIFAELRAFDEKDLTLI